MGSMLHSQAQPSPCASSSSANIHISAGSGTSSFPCHISPAPAPPAIALTEQDALEAALNKMYERISFPTTMKANFATILASMPDPYGLMALYLHREHIVPPCPSPPLPPAILVLAIPPMTPYLH
eukprot:7318580-Ditylum_brightwellii.AAC.1